MGFVLGLLGGGGSILTVPILVYLFHVPAVTATSYSLFIVGLTSAFAAIRYKTLIDYKAAILFSLPAGFGVYMSRSWLLPSLADQLFFFDRQITKDQLILIVFSIMVLIISGFMFYSKDPSPKSDANIAAKKPYWYLALVAVLVGVFTGFVGAGGGFVIVPALTLLWGVSLKRAIATSLFIISVKSTIGFLADSREALAIDWSFLLGFLCITLASVLGGIRANASLSATVLRRSFAVFILFMGCFILIKELF